MTTQPRRQGWVVDEGAQAAYRALVTSCRATLAAMPRGCTYSHLTAARLLELPGSYVMDADTRLHVMRPIASNRVRLPGVCGHRALHPRESTVVMGLPVVGLADTWVDLGELVGRGKPVGLDDLIMIGDACASRLGTIVPLRDACQRRVRPRGKRTLLEALDEIRVGSASPGETLARLMLVRGGLPEPALNQPIMASREPQRLLGIGDLVWRFSRPDGRVVKVVGEYQGELFHAGRAQRAHDLRRKAGLREDGWRVEEIWRADVAGEKERRQTLYRFADALEVPRASLRPFAVNARFFSSHAIDLAIQRQMQRSARS